MSAAASPAAAAFEAPRLRSVGVGALVYGFGQAAGRLLLFLTLPIFTAYLAPDEFGLVALLAVLGFFARAAFGLGIGVSLGLVYFESGDPGRRAAAIWTAVAALSASGGFALLLSAAFAGPLAAAALGDPTLGGLVVAQAALVAAQLAAEPLLLRLQYERRPFAYVAATFGGALVGVGAAFLFVAVLGRGVSGWIEGFLLGALSTLALAAVRALRDPGLRHGRFDPALVRPLLRHGLPMVPSFGFLFLLQNSGAWFLKELNGLGSAGLYHVGWSIGMAMGVATAAFSAAWHPFFNAFAPRPQDGAAAFAKALGLYVFLFGGLCLAFFALARPVVALAAAPAYGEAFRVVGPVALAQFLIGLWSVLLPGMYFAREVHWVPLAQGLAAAAAVGLSLALARLWGMDGVALAMAAGAGVMVAAQLAVNRARGYAASRLDWRRPGALLALLAASAAAQRALDAQLGMAAAAVAGLGLLALYLAVGLGLGLAPSPAAALRWRAAR